MTSVGHRYRLLAEQLPACGLPESINRLGSRRRQYSYQWVRYRHFQRQWRRLVQFHPATAQYLELPWTPTRHHVQRIDKFSRQRAQVLEEPDVVCGEIWEDG